MDFLIPNNNYTILDGIRLPPSLGILHVFLNLVPVKLYNEVICRKNSFLVSSYMWGNHLHRHIHNYWYKISALTNPDEHGSLTTAVICVLSETAPPNFGQCLSKLSLSHIKCPFTSLKFPSDNHVPFFSLTFTIPVSSGHDFALSFKTIYIYENLPLKADSITLSEQQRVPCSG